MLLITTNILVLIIFSFNGGVRAHVDEPKWTYTGKRGVDYWSTLFPMCGGYKQSPVNINTRNAVPESFQPFNFSHYDDMPHQAILINNGHTLEIEWSGSNQPTMNGASLDGDYTFVQYHVHWGSDDLQGAEHTVNNIRCPMEMHFVHYKTKYGSMRNALNYPDGVAVLGVLFYIHQFDNPALGPLVSHLEKFKEVGEHVLTTELYPISTLLPRDVTRFYRYAGSLTTPTCNEDVNWTVFDEQVPVSEKQMLKIRSIHNAEGGPLLNNFRPTQLLHRRTVWRSFSTGCFDDPYSFTTPHYPSFNSLRYDYKHKWW